MTEYLTNQELASLVEAIKTAESYSTGEIRVHIDSHTEGDNARKAWDVFRKLGMDKTKERNAVLFHINFVERYFTIIGDKDIHHKVSQAFWDQIHDDVAKEFANAQYFNGLKNAILKTGLEFKKYFPFKSENINELPDEITFS